MIAAIEASIVFFLFFTFFFLSSYLVSKRRGRNGTSFPSPVRTRRELLAQRNSKRQSGTALTP